MSENVHDKGYKRILAKKKNFLSLLRNFINEDWTSEITEDDLELIDKEFILKDFKEREADVIYKIKFRGKEIIFYCLLELQSSVDYTMPFRLLIYMTEVWRRYFSDYDEQLRERVNFRLPAIIPVVLYNGHSEWTAVRSFKEYLSEYESFGSRVVDFEYIFLEVNKYNDEDLKGVGDLISSVFLMDKSQSNEDLKNNMAFMIKAFASLTSDQQMDFKDWLKDVLLKKSKTNQKGFIDSAIQSFEKGEVEHMTYAIERIFDEVEEKGIVKGIEKGLMQGLEKGLKQGLEKGREEGLQEGKIEVAKELLAEGEPLERIAKLAKLPLEAIKALQN